MVLLHRKLNFTKDPVQRGGGGAIFFRGGSPTFSGGIQMLISIKTHIT